MKEKLVGIFICMLLTVATILPVAGYTTTEVHSNNRDMIDQKMENCGICEFFPNYAWQEFIPTVNNLVRVEVNVAETYGNEMPSLNLSIERPLGNILTQKSLPWSAIPHDFCNWTSFDVPDISITPGLKYYIVLSYDLGGEYSWCGAWENPYLPGESNKDPDWDWTFRTFYEEEPEECCLMIESMSGGLFSPTASLKITTVIKNIGGAECKDITWKYYTTGGVVLWGPKSGTESSLLPGDTVTVKSRIFIGLAIPGIFPGNVTITADAANNACAPAEMTKGLFLVILLLDLV